jgi:hypothetical protein
MPGYRSCDRKDYADYPRKPEDCAVEVILGDLSGRSSEFRERERAHHDPGSGLHVGMHAAARDGKGRLLTSQWADLSGSPNDLEKPPDS